MRQGGRANPVDQGGPQHWTRSRAVSPSCTAWLQGRSRRHDIRGSPAPVKRRRTQGENPQGGPVRSACRPTHSHHRPHGFVNPRNVVLVVSGGLCWDAFLKGQAL